MELTFKCCDIESACIKAISYYTNKKKELLDNMDKLNPVVTFNKWKFNKLFPFIKIESCQSMKISDQIKLGYTPYYTTKGLFEYYNNKHNLRKVQHMYNTIIKSNIDAVVLTDNEFYYIKDFM